MENLNEKTFELLEATGLNWTVKKEILVSSVEGKPTQSFGLFRSDNGNWLSTVGKRYVPYQNYEMAEHLLQACEGVDLAVTRGGSLSGGRKIYLQAELPEIYIGRGIVKRWITGLNIHDKGSIAFGSTNMPVKCENTYHTVYGELSKFSHFASAPQKISEFLKGLRKAIGLDEQLIEKFKIMSDNPLRDEIFANVLKACFEVDLDAKASDVSSQQKAKMTKVSQAIETEIKLEGNTLWGLFNGITRYTNHMAVKPEKSKEYVMTGAGYDISNTAFNEIMRYIEENTAHPMLVELP